MRAYFFTEIPYPDAWSHADREPIRVTLPNKYFDPKLGADLINQRLDEYLLADELGMDLMFNEHRSTTTCLQVSCIPPVAMMARQTTKARLLVLGATIGVRADPLAVAEELSYIDVVSRGRLDMGLVKGYPAEIAPSNANPAGTQDRYWEAHDLIIKAMTHTDGPFNFEGEHFHYRQVNIWPRPYQQPHPPVWVTSFSPGSARETAERGYVVSAAADANLCRLIFDNYRAKRAEMGDLNPSLDRFSFLGLVGVGNTESEGFDRLGKVRGWVWSSGITPPAFLNPPGFNPLPANVKALKNYPSKDSWATRATGRSGKIINPSTCHPRDLIDPGLGFGGTPDQVYAQIADFYHYVGGLGHFLAMMQGGTLEHEEANDSIRLFAKEVMPRLKDLAREEPRYRSDRVKAGAA